MSNITVAEILKIHGDWIKSKDLVDLVREKQGVSERMAYINIKKAYENKEILKLILPDRNRTVIYGLPDFGLPKLVEKEAEKVLTFAEAFRFNCFRELQEINDLAVSGKPKEALGKLTLLIRRLPESLKKKIIPFENEHKKRLSSLNPKKQEYDIECLLAIEDLTDKISTLLHEYNKS